MASGDTLTDRDFEGTDPPLKDSDFKDSVSYPSEIPAKMKSFPQVVKQALPPALANAAGGWAAPAALGALGVTNPWLLAGAGILGAGAANVASSKALPESLGGNPKSSITSDFLWGAGPQAIGAGIGAGVGRFANKHLSEAENEFREQGRKGILDPINLQVQENLQTPTRDVPVPLEDLAQRGPLLTAQANEARAPIWQTIHGMRDRVGSQIGKAYQALKGEDPLDENETQTLIDRFEGIMGGMNAPSGLGAKYLNQLKALSTKNSQLYAQQLQAQGYSPDVIKQYLATNAPQEITVDDLRNMWQQMSNDLRRTAAGGDKHALAAQRGAIDDVLLPKMPANLRGLRDEYRGIMTRWPYSGDNELAALDNPNDISKWAFKDPRKAFDLYTSAGPQQRDQLRNGFVQYVWGDMDVRTGQGKDIAEQVRRRLAPYMESPQAAKALLGDQPYEQMNNMVSWAKYGPDLAQRLEKDPKYRAAFDAAYEEFFLRRGEKPADATVKSLGALLGLPAGPKQAWTLGAQNGPQQIAQQTPFLPTSSSGRRMSMAPFLAARHGGLALLHAGMGNMGWAGMQGAEAAMWMGGGHGFNAAAKMGPTRLFVNAFRATSPAEKGWLFARAMSTVPQIAAQWGRQTLPVETNDAAQ